MYINGRETIPCQELGAQVVLGCNLSAKCMGRARRKRWMEAGLPRRNWKPLAALGWASSKQLPPPFINKPDESPIYKIVLSLGFRASLWRGSILDVSLRL
jgi:hypothetical protein